MPQLTENTPSQWQAVIADLTAKQHAAREHIDSLRKQKQELALEAAMGGADAKKRLDKANSELARLTLESDDWDSAIATAKSHLDAARAEEAAGAERSRHAEMSALAHAAIAHAEAIPGCESWTPVKVVRKIYQLAAEGKSCFAISDDLTRLGIPPTLPRMKKSLPVPGKRQKAIATIWRPSHVRNLIVNTTYKGIHQWGKRGKVADEDGEKRLKARPREQWITRPCPAIVGSELWEQANATLHRNQIAAMAHPKNDYLLRGLIRCSICGLTFCGVTAVRRNGRRESYYRCNGKQQARGIFGKGGKRCPSPGVRGPELEAGVWAEIEGFLSRPGAVIRQLEAQMAEGGGEGRRVADEIREMESALARNAERRNNLVDMVTDGFISREDFKRQEQRIAQSQVENEERLRGLRQIATDAASRARSLGQARSVLETIRANVRGGKLAFEERRKVVEALVAGITVTPVDGLQPTVRVKYAFDPERKPYPGEKWSERARLALADTGRGSCNKRDLSLKPECRAQAKYSANRRNSD